MAFDVKKAVEGKTKEDLQKLMEMGLKKRAMIKKGGGLTLPGSGSAGQSGAAQDKPIPGKVQSAMASIGKTIDGQKGSYKDHIDGHIREVKEYLASR
ncbi:hypothetical protein KAI46_05985 [bacterium]|nr:hypothetical protein [bacterium]